MKPFSIDFDIKLLVVSYSVVSDEISVAEFVGLCSSIANVPVKPSMPIVGRVVVSGSMMPLTTSLNDIVVAAVNAGAKKIMIPDECKEKFEILPVEVKKDLIAIFYSTPIDAAKKALGMEE